MSILEVDMTELEVRMLAQATRETEEKTRNLYIEALANTPSGPERHLLKTVAYPYLYGYNGNIRNLLKH